MTKQEFEERIGHPVTDNEYAQADAIYLAAGDMDKDTFCELYKSEEGLRNLVGILADRVYTMEANVDALRNKIKSIGLQYLEHHQCDDDDAKLAVAILGYREYIRVKLEKDYYLTKSDREKLITLVDGGNIL